MFGWLSCQLTLRTPIASRLIRTRPNGSLRIDQRRTAGAASNGATRPLPPPRRWYVRRGTATIKKWNRYLAIHRHGGLDAGLARLSWEANGQRGFSLRRTVGVVWIIAQLQIEVAEKWPIVGPWEVSLAMRNTASATLGDVAEGWAECGDFRHDGSVCRDAHVLHRWAVDAIDPPSLALDAGARVENSFGTTHRRHLAARGEYEGQFDPRFGW